MPDVPAELLRVEGLSVGVTGKGSRRDAIVDQVSLSLSPGEKIALVGESGSGKTTFGLSLIGLLPRKVEILEGSICFEGRELTGLSDRQLRDVRGKGISMVFQDPMSGLDPLRRVGAQVTAAARRGGRSRRQAREQALECMAAVGIPLPAERARAYPHQLSGGLLQRVLIAMALVNEPRVLIADEPTTALDATIQAQILDMLRRLSVQRGTLLVTHDLGVAADFADRVVVMYGGQVLEEGPVGDVLSFPLHPYTEGLIDSRPKWGMRQSERLRPIAGVAPRPGEVTMGCVFAPRCPRVREECRQIRPELVEHSPAHRSACFFPSVVTLPVGGGGAIQNVAREHRSATS